MIVTEKGIITHIKPTELKFIAKEIRHLYGVEELPLLSDDLMIFINKPHNDSTIHKFFANEESPNGDEKAFHMIAITLYGKKTSGSLVKTSVELPDMITIFNGRSIEIQLTQDGHVLCGVDEIKVKLPLNNTFGQLLIFDQERLKYWISQECCDETEIGQIENGELRGKVNWETMDHNPLTLPMLFDSFDEKEFTQKVVDTLEKTRRYNQNQVLTSGDKTIEFSICGRDQIELNIRCQTEIEKEIETLFYHTQALNLEDYKKIASPHGFTSVISQSNSMGQIKKMLEKVSPTKANVLLTGESGTGKTLIAQEIHLRSNRSRQPFVVLNCAAIPENLIESELFGYEEGAFTGAKRSGKLGYFELANHGTLFLDEIGELPLSSQGRLLEVLQNNSFYRVGGSKKITVDVRIIAATNLNLEERVELKLFRKDLYYRLSVFPIKIPPLRERLEDVSMLSRRILPKICDRLELEPMILGQEAVKKLTGYHWPGNVRELENVLERALIVCEGRVVLPEHLQFENQKDEDPASHLKLQVEQFEKRVIYDTLVQFKYNKSMTAQKLGIGRTTLFEKMKRYGLEGDFNAE